MADEWSDALKQLDEIHGLPDSSFVVVPEGPTVEPVQIFKSSGRTCPTCKTNMAQEINMLVCASCGFSRVNASSCTDEQYTTTTKNTPMQMRIIGRGSAAYGQKKALLRTSNYTEYRDVISYKNIISINSNSLTNKRLPKNVIDYAHHMFSLVQQHGCVVRMDVKTGVLSSCLYYACYMNNISKTPAEIAAMTNVAERFLSMGERILRDLAERGVLDLPERVNPISDYVSRYMELLTIDKKYLPFVCEIIDQAARHKLHVLSDSRNTTKCIGALYLLIERMPELRKVITDERIIKTCVISKTTYMKYYNILCKYYKLFVPIFVKHRVYMKNSWRDSNTRFYQPVKKIKVKPIVNIDDEL
jgi:transcription initiation factor TFIIIB Brf1 subunit/transcription initiation factor TFIIB